MRRLYRPLLQFQHFLEPSYIHCIEEFPLRLCNSCYYRFDIETDLHRNDF